MQLEPTLLEQLVVRINQLLQPEGASVVWHPPMLDPDTGQTRQVDGMISRDGKHLHVECRAHARVQGVKWIEELIGRRASLRADGMIAVSASGFNGPARQKAEQFGIFLRTVQELSDEEIRHWGAAVSVAAAYVCVLEARVSFAVDHQLIHNVPPEPALCLPADRRGLDPRLALVETLIHQEKCAFFVDRPTTIKARVELPGLLVGLVPVMWSDVTLVTRLRRETISVLGQWSYGSPPTADAAVDATVTHYDLGETELIQTMDAVSLCIDLSNVVVPSGCYPYVWEVDLGRIIRARVKYIGQPSLNISGIRFTNSVIGVAAG